MRIFARRSNGYFAYKKYIEVSHVTKEGEAAEEQLIDINQKAVEETGVILVIGN